MNLRLLEIIKQKLDLDFKDTEIIYHSGSIWVVDMNRLLWYVEIDVEKEMLFWRPLLMENYQSLFSISVSIFNSILIGWICDFISHNKILITKSTELIKDTIHVDSVQCNPYGMIPTISEIISDDKIEYDFEIKISKSEFYKI